jgi:hypothetical protein
VEIYTYDASTKRSLNLATFDKISESGMVEIVEILFILKGRRKRDRLLSC